MLIDWKKPRDNDHGIGLSGKMIITMAEWLRCLLTISSWSSGCAVNDIFLVQWLRCLLTIIMNINSYDGSNNGGSWKNIYLVWKNIYLVFPILPLIITRDLLTEKCFQLWRRPKVLKVWIMVKKQNHPEHALLWDNVNTKSNRLLEDQVPPNRLSKGVPLPHPRSFSVYELPWPPCRAQHWYERRVWKATFNSNFILSAGPELLLTNFSKVLPP